MWACLAQHMTNLRGQRYVSMPGMVSLAKFLFQKGPERSLFAYSLLVLLVVFFISRSSKTMSNEKPSTGPHMEPLPRPARTSAHRTWWQRCCWPALRKKGKSLKAVTGQVDHVTKQRHPQELKKLQCCCCRCFLGFVLDYLGFLWVLPHATYFHGPHSFGNIQNDLCLEGTDLSSLGHSNLWSQGMI